MNPNGNELVVAENLSASYGNYLALDKVGFQGKKGEFVSLVGKSGTGKSTFLNALAGFIPYSGKIVVPETIGYVFQNHALFPWKTVRGNIAFGIKDLDRSDRNQRIRDLLVKIEMSEHADKYPGMLSGGQIQRVALARSLAPDPELLLMDEPYASLDHHTRERMQEWLLSVWQGSSKTVLFVTHYIEEAIFLSDRIIVLQDKRFVADVPVPFSRPRSDDLRFTEHFLDMKRYVLDCMENGG